MPQVPQDIPVESSETFDFVPDCLKPLGPKAPSFRLGTPTGREKRYIRRLYVRNGVQQHGQDAIRAEILKGLEELWSDAAFVQNGNMLRAYWEAIDDYALCLKDDPELKFEYDTDVIAACDAIPRKVAKFWPPIGEMLADNADFAELTDPIHVAVVLKKWSFLAVPAVFDEGYGYITTDCAEAIKDELEDLCRKQGLATAADTNPAWTELVIACFRRITLDEEEAKNSASPGSSETLQADSKATTRSTTAGKSRASGRSRKTPPSA